MREGWQIAGYRSEMREISSGHYRETVHWFQAEDSFAGSNVRILP